MPYQDVMNVILPNQGNHSAHITGHYGEVRAKGPHGGSDFNYEGGQTGVNLTHPAIHSPIAGEVTFVGGQYGTIKIRDADGNSHEILHTQSQSVQVGQHIQPGDEIGQMGGRGPDGSGQYAQHVHYQMKDAQGHAVNPEEFWRDRHVQPPGGAAPAHAPAHAGNATHGHQPNEHWQHLPLREGAHGTVVHSLQEHLNTLGVTDANGHPLVSDGHFGAHTKEAVEKFQGAHGLQVDGVAGPRTLQALEAQRTPRIDGTAHPDHAIYQQARDGVHHIDAQHGRNPDDRSDRLAAALTVAARQEGMGRIDHVALNGDASRTYAVQGELNSPFKKVAEVDTQQAMSTSMEQSSHAWKQASQQSNAEQAQQTHTQTQAEQQQSQRAQASSMPGV
jgi:putative chitinase